MNQVKKIVVTSNKEVILERIKKQIRVKEAMKNHIRSGMPLKTFVPENAH